MKYTARLPEKNVNVTPTSPLRELFVLLGGLLCVIVGIYFALGLAVDMIVPRISVELEQKLSGYFVNLKPAEKTSDQTKAVQKMADNMHRKCSKLPYKLSVYVSDSSMVNAVALPGGNIVVFSGLLDKMKSENELAFVLAHEMGHFANRDHLRGLGRGLVFIAISALIFGSDSGVGDFLSGWINITEMSFSREQESKADKYALNVLNCTYGHVGGATDFFDKMSKEEHIGFFKHFFLSHPESKKRISALKEYARSKDFVEGELRKLPPELGKMSSKK